MKLILLLPAFLLLAAGCTGHKQSSEGGHEHHSEATADTVAREDHGTADHALMLNEGKKWKVDEPTRVNIQGLQKTFSEASSQASPNFHQLAEDLQSGTDKLVRECRMTGADHDALHVWLEGYLPALKGLHASDSTQQQAAFNTLREQLGRFNEYFE